MTKTAALTKTTPLDAARAELAHRSRRRDADLAQHGAPRDYVVSPRSRHLRDRQAAHQALVEQAAAAVRQLEIADALAQVKAGALADVDARRAEAKARDADAQREAATLAEIAIRAVALQAEIAQLESDRHVGLEVAQGALAACSAAGDLAGAAAAAEEVARIEAAATAGTGRLRPLQLQLGEVEKMRAAAQERVDQARGACAAAVQALADAEVEVRAIARDEAALAFREAHVALLAGGPRSGGWQKNLHVEFSVGASRRLLEALGKGWHESLLVTGLTVQREVEALRPVEESVLAVDPLTLADTVPTDPPAGAPAARGPVQSAPIVTDEPVRRREAERV